MDTRKKKRNRTNDPDARITRFVVWMFVGKSLTLATLHGATLINEIRLDNPESRNKPEDRYINRSVFINKEYDSAM